MLSKNLPKQILRAAVAAAVLIFGNACGDSSLTAPKAPATSPAKPDPFLGISLFPSSDPSLVSCPTDQTLTTSGTIGILGGTLSIGGTSVVIPSGALLGDTPMTLTIPASQYMQIDVSVTGQSTFLFQKPITVTIDYSRCSNIGLLSPPVQAWNIDEQTDALLQNMGGLDLRLLDQITFTTIHLSGYAIAF